MSTVNGKIKDALTLYTNKLKEAVIEPLAALKKKTQYISSSGSNETAIDGDLNVLGGQVEADDFLVAGKSINSGYDWSDYNTANMTDTWMPISTNSGKNAT